MKSIPNPDELQDLKAEAAVNVSKKIDPDAPSPPKPNVLNDEQMKLWGPRIYLHPIPSGYLALLAIFMNSLVINIGEQKCTTYLKGMR